MTCAIHYCTLVNIYTAVGAFMRTTHENGAIATIDHQRWCYCYFLHPFTLENAFDPPACMFSYRAAEADRSTTRKIPWSCRHLSLPMSFFRCTHNNGVITTVDRKRCRLNGFVYEWSLDNDVKSPLCVLVSSDGGRLQHSRRNFSPLPTFFSVSEVCSCNSRQRGYYHG